MNMSYDGVVFDLLLLEDYIKEQVLDPSESDFLYWHHVIDGTFTVGENRTDPRHFPPIPVNEQRVINTLGGKGNVNIPFPLVSPNGITRSPRHDLVPTATSNLRSARAGGPQRAAAAAAAASDVRAMTSFAPRGYVPRDVGRIDPQEDQRHIASPGASNTPPWTDNEVRTRLSRPRRQLLMWMYTAKSNGAAEFCLISPLTGLTTDAKDGPKITMLGTPRINGNSSLTYRLRIETWECPFDTIDSVSLSGAKANRKQEVSNKPAILSNRWGMRMEADPNNYLASFVVNGTAIFNMAVLEARQVTADQLRREFMHPIPMGFVRTPPMVAISPSGNGVQYEFTDHQVMSNFHAGYMYGLSNISAKQSIQYHCPADLLLNPSQAGG